MILLDVGSGSKPKSGFLGVDMYVDTDVQAPMWDLPFADGEVDAIYCSHALEHISKFQVVPTLREWKRVLKIGGAVKIIVPDLEWACLFWIFNPQSDWSMDILFGTQIHDGQFHKTGFSENIMKQYIDVCGGFEISNVRYLGDTVQDIIDRYQAPLKEIGSTFRVKQKCIDFELERIADPPVAQLEEAVVSNTAKYQFESVQEDQYFGVDL